MTNEECMGRLVVSATHDLRNALAVIRESAGLAEDMLRMQGADTPQAKRMLESLRQTQEQVQRGAALAESMAYLAACAGGGEGIAPRCDLNRVVRDFCIMILRRGRACALEPEACLAPEPVWANADARDIFRDLLTVFDACAAVGGGLRLRLTPVARSGVTAIACGVPPGSSNEAMALSALTACPLLQPAPQSWLERLLPGPGERRFLLPVGTRQDTDS